MNRASRGDKKVKKKRRSTYCQHDDSSWCDEKCYSESSAKSFSYVYRRVMWKDVLDVAELTKKMLWSFWMIMKDFLLIRSKLLLENSTSLTTSSADGSVVKPALSSFDPTKKAARLLYLASLSTTSSAGFGTRKKGNR